MPGCPEGAPPAPRLAFLDGLRGLAASYVVLHHAALLIPASGLGGPATVARFLLRHGHYAVAVFILLSGYCLMLPVARDPLGRLPGGLVAFLGRRARRILPPYYAALVVCWALIALVPELGRPSRARWDRALPAWGGGVVGSHLLLVHNLSERWMFKVDPPMWSVATEWQIYLLFPVLLALWRRGGRGAAVGGGFAVGYAVAALATPLGDRALRQLCPWYAGLFALGMAAAASAHGDPARRARGGRLAAGLGLVALVLAGVAMAGHDDADVLVADPLVGLATAGLLVRWSRRVAPGAARPRPPLLRLLEARGAVALGAVSYSLYLVHFPLLAWADALLVARGWGPDGRLGGLVLVASPLCLLVAWPFHLAFERPFLPAGRPDAGARHAPRRRAGARRPRPAISGGGRSTTARPTAR